MDKKVQREREEMDSKVQRERDEIDRKMTRERAAVDQTIKQERENMDHNLKQIHEEMYKKMQREREGMDKKVKQERETMDRTLRQMHEEMVRKLQKERKDIDHIVQLEHTKIDLMNMQARAEMDHNLRQERKDMDYKAKLEHIRMEGKMMHDRTRIDKNAGHEQCHIPSSKQYLSYSPPYMDRDVQVKRAKMDFMNVPPHADMDQKLQHERQVMDYESKLDQIRMEAKMMQDRARIDTKVEHEQCHIPSSKQSPSYSPPVLVMEFRVFKDRKFSHVPKGYVDRIPGLMIFNEPGKVEWSKMVMNLYAQGYKSNSDVYYIKPRCVPPEGMVLISSEEDVDQMMQVHEGIKKCDLYIEYPFEYIDCGERGSDENGSSPRTMHFPFNNPKKTLTFDNGDEHDSA